MNNRRSFVLSGIRETRVQSDTGGWILQKNRINSHTLWLVRDVWESMRTEECSWLQRHRKCRGTMAAGDKYTSVWVMGNWRCGVQSMGSSLRWLGSASVYAIGAFLWAFSELQRWSIDKYYRNRRFTSECQFRFHDSREMGRHSVIVSQRVLSSAKLAPPHSSRVILGGQKRWEKGEGIGEGGWGPALHP